MDEKPKRGRPLRGEAKRVRLTAWVPPVVVQAIDEQKGEKESNGDVIARWMGESTAGDSGGPL